MISRRRFLQIGTVAAGAPLAARSVQASTEAKCVQPPRSIASLKSMKDQAKPIAQQERRERQEKARLLMEANHLDAILLTEGTSLNPYLRFCRRGTQRADANGCVSSRRSEGIL